MTAAASTSPRRHHAARAGAGCAVVTMCAITGTLVTDPPRPTPQTVLATPGLQTRAVQFAALVQDMTDRQQQALGQISRAAATNTVPTPSPLAAVPAPAAAIDDLTGAIWGAIGNVIAVIPPNLLQATQTAFLTVLIAPVAGLIGLNVPPQLAPILPLIAVAYTVLSPVIAVGNFFSVLATGQPLPIYIPAGPLPWIYSVAATPPPAAPTAAAPVTVGATAPAPSRKAVPTSAVASASKPKPQQSPRSTAAIPKPTVALANSDTPQVDQTSVHATTGKPNKSTSPDNQTASANQSRHVSGSTKGTSKGVPGTDRSDQSR